MRDQLRAFLTNKRTPMLLLVVAVVMFGLFLAAGLQLGAAADYCAESLVHAIEKRDDKFIEETVKNPSLRDELLTAPTVELGYVRPLDSEWTRVGLFVRTATTTKQVVLQLSTEDDRCTFLRDY